MRRCCLSARGGAEPSGRGGVSWGLRRAWGRADRRGLADAGCGGARPGIAVHRCAKLDSRRATVTAAGSAIARDDAGRGRCSDLARCLGRASWSARSRPRMSSGSYDHAEIEAVIRRHRGRAGTRRLRLAAEAVGRTRPAMTRSELERRVPRARASLNGVTTPRVNALVEGLGGRLQLGGRATSVVEADSRRHHDTAAAFERDRSARPAASPSRGGGSCRVTHRQLRDAAGGRRRTARARCSRPEPGGGQPPSARRAVAVAEPRSRARRAPRSNRTRMVSVLLRPRRRRRTGTRDRARRCSPSRAQAARRRSAWSKSSSRRARCRGSARPHEACAALPGRAEDDDRPAVALARRRAAARPPRSRAGGPSCPRRRPRTRPCRPAAASTRPTTASAAAPAIVRSSVCIADRSRRTVRARAIGIALARPLGHRTSDRGGRGAARRRAGRRGVVTLRFSRGASTTRTRAARGLDERRVVGRGGEDVVGLGEHAPRARRGGRPAASGPPTGASGRACGRRRRPAPASFVVSVTGAAAIAASTPSSAVEAALDELRRRASGRAASWTRTGSPSPGAAERVADRVRALGPARDADGPRRAPRRPAGSATTISLDRGHGAQRLERPLEQRAPRNDDERLGSVRPKALATSCGDEEGDGHARLRARPLLGGGDLLARRSRRAARRGRARPPPRPSRARTSARRRGSSSRG